MRYPESVNHPRRLIQEVITSLERFGRYDFRSDGYVRIERWNANRALDAYRHTLNAVPGKIEGETPSATMVEEATVEWKAEPADIGMRVRQRHIGVIHPEVRPLVDKWVKAGKPYPSSGGFYHTIPNKSFQKVKDLMDYPELRDAVLNLGIEDKWMLFWDRYLPLRNEVSAQLLSLVQNKVDPEALSRHNAEAGTGLQIRGMRIKRKDISRVAGDLNFLLPYMFAMGIAFAAVQLAKLEPGQIWMIEVYDARIKGAVASRSDIDVTDVAWDGERLTIDGVSATRQAGSDCTGVLANSYTERRLMRSSVTERVLRDYRPRGVEYPFTDRELLLKVWGTDAKPFPNKQYIIGEDFGLTEPIKSPADALFSRGFMRIGNKVVPLMLSGSGWTQAVYGVFHAHFIERAAADDVLLALGDDMNLLTASSNEEMFEPYVKVKSTDPLENTKKVLGMFSVFSQDEDVTGEREAIVGQVPRVIKTLSSATKRGSQWGETLSNLPPSGVLELQQPEATMEAIKRDLPILLPYIQWSGPRRELNAMLQSIWTHIPKETWDILTRNIDELEYRLLPPELDEGS